MKMSINNLQSIVLGREKDGGVKTIEIDCSEWKEKFPQLTKYRIEVTSPNGIIYCPEVTMNEHILTWPITKSDTALTGKGAYQIVATGENDERLTSAHLSLNIYSIMPGTAQETPPEYIESWVQNIVDTAERAELAAKKAEDAAAGIVITPEEIQSAVDSYLIKNPIKVEETDPTVPDWAKKEKKPTYTAEEVGAQPKGDYVLKSDIPDVPDPYTLPVASADTLGGVKVGKGLQMDGDVLGVKPQGVYELVKTITLENDVTKIAIGELGGDLSECVMLVYSPATSIASIVNFFAYDKRGARITGTSIPGLVSNAAKYVEITLAKKSYGFKAQYRSGTTSAIYGWQDIHSVSNGNVARISLEAIATDAVFPIGTKIDLWGVRADA